MMYGKGHRGCSILTGRLTVYMREMIRNGFFTDMQFLRDLLVTLALHHKLQHAGLSPGKIGRERF